MIWLVACVGPAAEAESPAPIAAPVEPAAPAPWSEPAGASTIATAFPPPAGSRRIDGGPFGAYLAAMTVAPIDAKVTTYAGDEVFGHDARVIDLPLVPGDLQQCADSAIRVRAEWERSAGYSPSFHATSGDPMPWSRYEHGETPYAAGSGLAWKAGGTRKWDDWLAKVFTYAGTRSLALDTVAADDPRPGDLIVHAGSPGHAVVLLDVAVDQGVTYALVGEGFMPAQSFHVERGPYQGWWKMEGALSPAWSLLAGGSLRRWKDPAS